MDIARAIAILRRRAEQYEAKAAHERASQEALASVKAKLAEDDAEAIRIVLAALPDTAGRS